MANGQLNLLYAEADGQVLQEVSGHLQKAGYQVTPAEGRKAVLEAVKQKAFDMVILGGSLSRDDRHHLTYKVKRVLPNTKVLALHSDGARHPYIDANVDTGTEVKYILEKIAEVAPSRGAAKSAAAGK